MILTLFLLISLVMQHTDQDHNWTRVDYAPCPEFCPVRIVEEEPTDEE